MNLLYSLAHTLLETIVDVVPIAAVVVGFQVLVLRRRVPNAKQVVLGFLYVLVGMAFFLEGLERGLFPLGTVMAQQLTDPAFIEEGLWRAEYEINWLGYHWVYIFGAAIGFATTIAEPALIAVAIKARAVSAGAITVWGCALRSQLVWRSESAWGHSES